MEQTRAWRALAADPAVDLEALARLLVRFSQLVVDQPALAAIDINPLRVGAGEPRALEAAMTLHGPAVAEADLPRPVIRPYPDEYVTQTTMKDGTPVRIRPIRPEDEPAVVRFHHALSERTVHLRYFHSLQLEARVAHERLRQRCFIDYDREMALVVEPTTPPQAERAIYAIGRLTRQHESDEAEFALVVADAKQGQGLGKALLSRLVTIGRAEGVGRITAQMLRENAGMQRVSRALGFELRQAEELNLVNASLSLTDAEAPADFTDGTDSDAR